MSRFAPGLFVTGTDTGVGKTEIACGLIRAATRLGVRAAGMKPVAAGARRVRGRLRNDDVEALSQASPIRISRRLRNPYLFAPAIAPHLAARAAGVGIDLALLARAFRQIVRRADLVVVEGAGGFYVPLDDRLHMGHLAARLRLPVVLVVGMRLGCLSHALLTAAAIERMGLELAGWVANRIDPAMRRYRDNVESLRARIDAPLFAEIPYVADATQRNARIERAFASGAFAAWVASRTHARPRNA